MVEFYHRRMSCCEKFEFANTVIGRRDALKGLAGAGVGVAAAVMSGPASAQGLRKVKLAFCGQLLCVVPYEVTRAQGHFAAEGLEVELVYTRGGSQAMQALVGGAVDYAGTSYDVAVQAFARGAKIVRFASITTLNALEGHTVAVSGLGNADHTLVLYLMAKAGADASKVRFATLGTNLYDALRIGQVDAGMVQEPALSLLIKAGGAQLVNAMDIGDARKYLGGAYEFMGVAVRSEEREQRLDEMKRLARALAKGLKDTRTQPVEVVAQALPKELVAGGDSAQLLDILRRYRESLYPDTVQIDPEAAARVSDSLKTSGVITGDTDFSKLLDRTVVEG
jgi:NitT/TauT family transport system substrate-binding protein